MVMNKDSVKEKQLKAVLKTFITFQISVNWMFTVISKQQCIFIFISLLIRESCKWDGGRFPEHTSNFITFQQLVFAKEVILERNAGHIVKEWVTLGLDLGCVTFLINKQLVQLFIRICFNYVFHKRVENTCLKKYVPV